MSPSKESTKWEYKVATVGFRSNKPEDIEKFLNRLGEEGWELVIETFTDLLGRHDPSLTEKSFILKRCKL